MKMTIIKPLTLSFANEFITNNHRHSKKVTGHKFSVGLYDLCFEEITTVIIVGRPVARNLDKDNNLEILRICTLPWVRKNSISHLLSVVIKITKLLGYNKLVTYILDSENGSSLQASGFTMVSVCKNAKDWTNRPNRVNQEIYFMAKKRYELKLNP